MKSRFMLYFNIFPILLFPFFKLFAQQPQGTAVLNNFFVQYEVSESYAIQYERRFEEYTIPVFLRFGLSHTQPNKFGQANRWYGIPVGLTWVFGKKNGHFETGPGFVYRQSYHNSDVRKNTEFWFQWKLGYRFQKLHRNGINASIGISPTYATYRDDDFWDHDGFMLLYVTMGYSFR